MHFLQHLVFTIRIVQLERVKSTNNDLEIEVSKSTCLLCDSNVMASTPLITFPKCVYKQ